MKNITALMIAIVLLASALAKAQNMGSLSTTGGTVHLTHPSSAMLLPVGVLTSTPNPSPLTAHVLGMTVYNTVYSGSGVTSVVPGLYINDGTKWIIISGGLSYATYTSATINCGGTLGGTYSANLPMTTGNTKGITITSLTGGTYAASTTQVNGVTFAATGSLYSVGSGTQILLTATGTPLTSGTFHDTVTLGGQTCSFDVTYAPAATYTCASATQTQSPAGGITANNSYSGSYTIPYTAGNGTAYAARSQTIDGLTLSLAVGTYNTGSGNVAYSLAGTYTGTTGNVTFTVPECGTISFGDQIRAALTAASQANYDLATADNWVSITSTDFAALQLLKGAGTYGANNAQMGINNQAGGGYTYSMATGQNLVPASNYPIAVALKSCITAPTSLAGIQFKMATAVSGSYTTFPLATSAVTPNSAFGLSANTVYYFVLKKPATVTSSSSPSYIAYYMPVSGGIAVTQDNTVTQYYSSGNANGTLSSSQGYYPEFQILASPNKLW